MLHDISKGDAMRSLAKPNTNDDVQNRMAHNTTQTTYKTESNTNPQRITMKNGLILTYDSANRVSSVYGYIPQLSATPVLIIANAGYDVYTDLLGLTAPKV